MDPRTACEHCKLVYGMEQPRTESILNTRWFIGFWNGPENKSILIVDKHHEWNADPQNISISDKEKNLERALNRATKILMEKYPSKTVIRSPKTESEHFTATILTADYSTDFE